MPINGTKNLESERVVLKKLKTEYAIKAFENWCNDENVSKYMTWSTHKTVEDTKKWIKDVEKEINDCYPPNQGEELTTDEVVEVAEAVSESNE